MKIFALASMLALTAIGGAVAICAVTSGAQAVAGGAD
jgi:hypothetical protein